MIAGLTAAVCSGVCPDHVHMHEHSHTVSSTCAHVTQDMRQCVFRASQITPGFDRP